MTIDLHIPKPIKRTKRSVDLPDDIWSMLDQYVDAAKSGEPHANVELVLEALLRKQLTKDRGFQRWLKNKDNDIRTEAHSNRAEPHASSVPEFTAQRASSSV